MTIVVEVLKRMLDDDVVVVLKRLMMPLQENIFTQSRPLLTTHPPHQCCINTIPHRIQWTNLSLFSPFILSCIEEIYFIEV